MVELFRVGFEPDGRIPTWSGLVYKLPNICEVITDYPLEGAYHLHCKMLQPGGAYLNGKFNPQNAVYPSFFLDAKVLIIGPVGERFQLLRMTTLTVPWLPIMNVRIGRDAPGAPLKFECIWADNPLHFESDPITDDYPTNTDIIDPIFPSDFGIDLEDGRYHSIQHGYMKYPDGTLEYRWYIDYQLVHSATTDWSENEYSRNVQRFEGGIGWSDAGPEIYLDEIIGDTKPITGEPPPPSEHSVTIASGEGGHTNPGEGSYTALEGSQIIVEALPDAGYLFDYWKVNEQFISDNPISVQVLSDTIITAFFRSEEEPPTPPPGLPWHDGFDSVPDHYINWDAIHISAGDTVTADDAVYHHGGWSSKSTITSAEAGRIAWAMKKITATPEVWLRYYFRTDTLPDTSADGNMILSAAIIGHSHLAEVGLYVDGGQVKWVMGMYEDGGWTIEFSEKPRPKANKWYCIEVYVKVHATQGEYRLYVDGRLIIKKKNVNNAGLGDPDQIRVGVTNSVGQTCTVHVDSVRVSTRADKKWLPLLAGVGLIALLLKGKK